MLKKIVSIMLITISSFFIISDIRARKEYTEKVDIVLQNNKVDRKYDGYISFLDKKWLIKTGEYNNILNQNLVLMISSKEILNNNVGNIILAGHNNKYVFSYLYKLKKDDEITISDFDNDYIFKVSKITKVNIKDKNILDNVYDKKILTLITCTSNNQVRYVVIGEYIHTIFHN